MRTTPACDAAHTPERAVSSRKPDTSFTIAAPAARHSLATVALTVTLPLYQAGLTDAQARQAKQTAGQRKNDIETASRQTLQTAQQNWSLFNSAQAQVTAARGDQRHPRLQ